MPFMLDATDHRSSALASVLGLTAVTSFVFGLDLQPKLPLRAADTRPMSEPGIPELRAPSVAAPASAQLLVPVAAVARAELTRQFDEHRSGGRSHRAIDIHAPLGTPVLAAAHGRIERLMHSRLGGNTIYQRDASRTRVFYYAHLQRYRPGIYEGMPVRQGEVIGYVGTSGNAPENAPHLHFAIHRLRSGERWWQGEPLDPFDELAGSRLAAR